MPTSIESWTYSWLLSDARVGKLPAERGLTR